MQCLYIGVNEYAEDIKNYISQELQQLKNTKIDYSIDKVETGGSTSIVCSIREENLPENKSMQLLDTLRFHVSNALANYIIRQYEEKLITRIINSNYCYFNSIEKREIFNLAIKTIRNEDNNFLNSLFKIRRHNIIVKKLLDYFENSDSLVLDGFVNFRLKDYMKDLEEVVDKAVDDFLMEKEYKEFIRLLRYFVDIQESKFNVVHVLASFENKYTILDDTRREITNECIQEFVNEIPEGEINFDDLLVSSLITLAPKKIVIHGAERFKNKELLETIKNVFSGKVVLCSGCKMCSFDMIKSEQKK